MRFLLSLFLICLFVLSGCDTSSDQVAGNGGTTGTGDGGPRLGQALLGPVVDAVVNVYSLDDTSTPLCQVVSSNSSILDEAGLIEIPASCVTVDGVYLLEAIKGEDIDADDDGQLDVLSTSVEGRIRAVLTYQQMQLQGWKLSALTESAFQAVLNSLRQAVPVPDLLGELQRISPLLLDTDIDGDGDIDYDDVVLWSPVNNPAAISNDSSLLNILSDIHLGTNVTGQDVSPDIEHADTLSQANHLVVTDHIAYVGLETSFQIRSVDPQGSPFLMSSVATGFIVDLIVKDNYLVIALGEKGAEVYDISNPYQPGRVAYIESAVQDLVVQNNNIFFVDGDVDIYQLDLSQAANPVIQSVKSTVSPVSYLHAQDELLVYSERSASAVMNSYVYQVADPYSWQLLDSYTDVEITAVSGTALVLFLAFDDGIQQEVIGYDRSIPMSLLEQQRLQADARDMVVFSGDLYVVDGQAFEIYSNASFNLRQTIPAPGLKMSLDNNFLYLSAQQWGLCRWWVGPEASRPGIPW